MNKILKPKLLAIIAIITSLLSIVLSIIYNVMISNSHIPITTYIIQLFTNINLYIIIYLLVILKKKEKNMRTLNLILLICLVITSLLSIVSQVFYINQMYSIPSSMVSISKFKMWFDLINVILFTFLEIVMVYGILNKRKMPYKYLMIVLVFLTFISLVYSFINLGSYIHNKYIVIILVNMINKIIGVIKSCSFILFLYLYGKSINERSLKNER